jgi:hypothetical protein
MAAPTVLDWTELSDHENASRGLVDRLDPCVITDEQGRVVFEARRWGFLDDPCPRTVHPSLWRQARLLAAHGLFEVVPGVYQVLSQQRDAYAYIHDQTVRLMNRGLTGAEIAEELPELPGDLGRAWHLRGYYGSLSNNIKAVYQRYMGWYDGNPAHLWQHPPAEADGGTSPAWAAPTRFSRSPRATSTTVTSGSPSSCPPRGVRRTRSPRRAGTAGAGVRAARLRRRERGLAEHLPHRGTRAARPEHAATEPGARRGDTRADRRHDRRAALPAADAAA